MIKLMVPDIVRIARERFQWQHAQGLMTNDALITNLRSLDERACRLEDALASLASSPPLSGMTLTAAQVTDLRQTLADGSLTPRQKRDKLRLAVRYFVVSDDKQSLTAVLHASK